MKTLVRYTGQPAEETASEERNNAGRENLFRTTLTVVLSINLVVIAGAITLVTLLVRE